MQPDLEMINPHQRTAEEICRSIYAETKIVYEAASSMLSDKAFGYRILYGPPVVNPEYLFIGYQPGGKADSIRSDQMLGWPLECEYGLDDIGLKNAGWVRPRFAINMRTVWGRDTLRLSTGLNAIFFRAPTVRDWKRLDKVQRIELEDFSLQRARRIVTALQPKRLVVIGLGTFSWLTGQQDASALERNNRVLIRRGELWDVPAFGIIHLSGARVSGDDLTSMASYFSKLRSN